jgi:hypothetical protein
MASIPTPCSSRLKTDEDRALSCCDICNEWSDEPSSVRGCEMPRPHSSCTGERIERVPFAFIDSFEESASLTQGPMTTWESLLGGLVAAARARGADHDEEMAAVVDEFANVATLERVVTQVPAELEAVSDAALGERSTMTPAALREWLVPLKAT